MTLRVSTHRYGRIVPAFAVVLAVACQAFAQTKIVAPRNSYSVAEDVKLGREASAEVRKELPMLNDDRVDEWVEDIGATLVRAIPAEFQHPEFRYTFDVINQKEINAFALPGGPMYLNRGMIEAAKTEGEVAGVMAHEISHGVSRHATEQLSKAYGANILVGLALGGNPPIYQQLLAQIIAGGTFAKFSRDAENEADHLGVLYMYNAGYDPHGMVTMFQELISRRQSRPGSVETFFSSHPLTEDRIEGVRAQIQQLPPKQNLILRDGEFESMQRRVGC